MPADRHPARRAIALLAVLVLSVVAAFTLGASPAVANTGSLSGNAVAASNLAQPDGVGPITDVGPGQGRETDLDSSTSALGCCVATKGLPQNARGEDYPQITDLKTGEPIQHPGGDVARVPKADRVPALDNYGRRDFIREWYDQGYATPSGGWADYDIHHILPREFGGTNDFDNLTPVLRMPDHNGVGGFTQWWRNC